MAILAWVTFPGGGVYPAIWLPATTAVLLCLTVTDPAIATGRHRRLDIVLAIALATVAVQLIPMPPWALRQMVPHSESLRGVLWPLPPNGSPVLQAWRPISIVPSGTWDALAIFAGAIGMFWLCRSVSERAGAGRIVRGIAWIGLTASLAAILLSGSSREKLYGIWQPLDPGARPFGPFVNRNHFATWLLMAGPLVFGYVAARIGPGSLSSSWSQRLADRLQQIGTVRVWLVTSVAVMTLALLLSTSRSGLIGLAGAAAVNAALAARARGARPVRRSMLACAVFVVVTAVSFANVDALMARFDETTNRWEPGRGRLAVWQDATRVVRDFPATGTGAGTFGIAALAYQQSERGYSIGQAHNHYLQLAAEGGLLFGLPVAVAAVFLLGRARDALRDTADRDYLIRAGAASGIAAVVLQSVWETGLRMPANAMMFAVLAAITTCAPQSDAAAQRAQ